MFDDVGSNQISDESQNIPGLAFTATPVLGNVEFTIQAPQGLSKVQPGFPSFDYVSVESLLFFQSLTSTNIAPSAILGGSNTGQQVTSGNQTMVDANGTARFMQGYQSTSTAS